MLSCRDVTELVTEYEEGALALRPRLRVRLHLLMCKLCRRYFAQMRAVADALGRLPREAPPDTVRWRLTAAFRDAARTTRQPGGGSDERS